MLQFILLIHGKKGNGNFGNHLGKMGNVAVFTGCRLPYFYLPIFPKRLPKFSLPFLPVAHFSVVQISVALFSVAHFTIYHFIATFILSYCT